MTSYDSLDDALAHVELATRLTLDLSKGQPLSPDIARLVNLESLVLRNCPEHFDAPDALRELSRLEHLSLSAEDDKLVVPRVLQELPIKWLELWDADVRDILPMKHLQRLYFVTKNPKEDTALLARHLPRLVHLELAGFRLKDGELPPDIERFEDLEVLSLLSCGVRRLPEELARLGKLHTLRMVGLPMVTFPEVITRLEGLRTLQFGQRVASLPESLSRLSQLVDLDLSDALNKGTMDAAYEPPPRNLKPLPPVLGTLTNLEHLNLSSCGVLSLDVIAPLTRLERLELDYSGLQDCAGLAPFQRLQELSLSGCGRLRDISQLAKLPRLRKLNLESCDLRDLGPIADMKALEELNIEYCSEIKSVRPVLLCASLQKLEADEEVLEKWNQRHEAGALEGTEDVLAPLETASTPEEANEALLGLARYVQANSTGDRNALESVFDVESLGEVDDWEEDGGYVALPALDSLLERFLPRLSSDALAATVESTLRSLEHEVGATLVVVRELVRRQDAAAQVRVVRAFRNACQFYDAGHRAFERTVHDVLMDELFPAFEPGPLSLLLKVSGADELYYDQMDALFLPAFQRAREAEALERLRSAFLGYLESYRHQDSERFSRLLSTLGDVLPAQVREALAEGEPAEQALREIKDDLESGDPVLVGKRMLQLGGEIPREQYEELEDALLDAFRSAPTAPAYEALLRYLTVLFERDEHSGIPSELVFALAQKDFARLEQDISSFLEAHPDWKEVVTFAVRNSLHDAYDTTHDASPEVLEALRQLASRLTGRTGEELRLEEVTRQLLNGVQDVDKLDDALKLLDTVSEPLKLTSQDGSTFASHVVDLAVMENFEEVCKVARHLPRLVLSSHSLERVLAQAIPSAIHSGDEEVKELCLKLAPKEVTWDILAFNLACLCALRGDKPALLQYTRRAIVLGKPKAEFLDDSDFKAYLRDPEFLEALKDG